MSDEYDNFMDRKENLGNLDHLFDDDSNAPVTHDYWVGMPEFIQEKKIDCYKSVVMKFKSKEDYEEFQKVIGQKMTDKTKTAWFPDREVEDLKNVWWDDENES